jgi:hypothetical protein
VKKFGIIIIAFVYLLLSVGIAKSTHICMGRALPASFFSFESEKCFCSDSNQPDTCCDDQFELVKIDNDQSIGQVVHSPIPDFNFLGELFSETTEIFISETTTEFLAEYNPPPPKISIYQSVCSLIFYEAKV